MNCPSCGEQLSERGYFCKACATQARCMNCRELLETSAVACVECGTRIGQRNGASPIDHQPTDGSVTSMPPNRNTLTYREDRNSRTFDASLTDSAMENLGDVFGELFARAGGRPPQTHHRSQGEHEVELRRQLPPAPEQLGEQPPPAPTIESPGTDKYRLLRLFNPAGETFELIDNRLKAKNGSDYLRRLTYLFLYVQEVHGRAATPRADLLKLLKDAKMYDSNALTWLKKKVKFSVDGDDRLRLSAPGREEAVTALNQALDPNIPDDWNPDKKTPQKRAPRKKP